MSSISESINSEHTRHNEYCFADTKILYFDDNKRVKFMTVKPN
jgi:hypothetical protein